MDSDASSDEEYNFIASNFASTIACVCGAYYLAYIDKNPQRNCYLTERQFVNDVTQSNEHCYNLLRMNVESFRQFVYIFKGTGRLKDTVHCSVEEQLTMFLHIVSHNVKNHSMKCYFKRSGETISRYFNTVLDAIIGMEDEFMKQPTSGMETPIEIHSNPRMWPYFKNCVGAIDDTHLPAKVSVEYVARFRGRKQWPSQNVLTACTFDLKFTYVLAGWEGSASDSRILACAINRVHGIKCPPGKHYLVDAGFPLLKHYITPFRSTRYHLNEIRGCVPTTPKELFNHRYSSLHNTIEQAFGVLKKRFQILVDELMFSFATQIKLIIACCFVHNHIRGVMPDDPLLRDVDREMNAESAPIHDAVDSQLSRVEDGREGKRIRTEIMNQIWNDFTRGHH